MRELVRRKRRLVLETPYRIRGRAVIVHVEAAGLRFREKAAGLAYSKLPGHRSTTGLQRLQQNGPASRQEKGRKEDDAASENDEGQASRIEISQLLLDWANGTS